MTKQMSRKSVQNSQFLNLNSSFLEDATSSSHYFSDKPLHYKESFLLSPGSPSTSFSGTSQLQGEPYRLSSVASSIGLDGDDCPQWTPDALSTSGLEDLTPEENHLELKRHRIDDLPVSVKRSRMTSNEQYNHVELDSNVNDDTVVRYNPKMTESHRVNTINDYIVSNQQDNREICLKNSYLSTTTSTTDVTRHSIRLYHDRKHLSSSSMIKTSIEIVDRPIRQDDPFISEETFGILPRIYADESIGCLVAQYLKPSEIRNLIFILQIQQQSVAGYYELLCRMTFSELELSELLREYYGIFSTTNRQIPNWSIDPLNYCSSNLNPISSEDDVEFVGASFDSSFGKPDNYKNHHVSKQPPFELIYKVEIFGRYCDECQNCLTTPQLFPPDVIKIPLDNHGKVKFPIVSLMTEQSSCPSQIKLEIGEDYYYDNIHTKTQQQQQQQQQLSSNQLNDRYFIIDRSITRVIFCCNCRNLFINRDTVEDKRKLILRSASLLKQCHCIDKETMLHVYFDHAGDYVSRASWNKIERRFSEGCDIIIDKLRNHFSRRLARRFGQTFYQEFIHKILPSDRFLQIDKKQRKYNPIGWVKKISALGKRQSRFRDGPLIDRYPLGSLERSTALAAEKLFNLWAKSLDLNILIETEIALVKIFRLAHDIYYHPDYSKASNIVEDFILTRQIHQELFDIMFLPSLWRVLHRGQTREQRTFTGCIYDRQRIDKFFSPCCQGNYTVIPVKGYLGFESDDNSNDEKNQYLTQKNTSSFPLVKNIDLMDQSVMDLSVSKPTLCITSPPSTSTKVKSNLLNVNAFPNLNLVGDKTSKT